MARRKQEPDVLPIRIRANLVVTVTGLPHDLTYAEARKIADVIVALGGSPLQADPPEQILMNRPGQLDVDETGDWLPNVRRVGE